MNFKASGAAAGAGFVFSLLTGIFSGAAFPGLLLKALVFAALFFGLASVVQFLVRRFLPELVEDAAEAAPPQENAPGSNLNIMEEAEEAPLTGEGGKAAEAEPEAAGGEDSAAEAAPPDTAPQAAREPEEQGNPETCEISETGEKRLEQIEKTGYTTATRKKAAPLPEAAPDDGGAAGEGQALPVFPAPPEGGGLEAEALPDLDSLAGAFVLSPEDAGESAGRAPSAGAGGEAGEKKPSSARPGQGAGGFGGKFDPKELAAAVRTKLNQDGG
ncbi:MAG: hypothetical protein MdMp014T_0824 [Treponematales bacterium]